MSFSIEPTPDTKRIWDRANWVAFLDKNGEVFRMPPGGQIDTYVRKGWKPLVGADGYTPEKILELEAEAAKKRAAEAAKGEKKKTKASAREMKAKLAGMAAEVTAFEKGDSE